MLKARFQARSTSTIPDQNRFVILGEVVEGDVRPSMRFEVRLNSSVVVQGVISGIKTINTADGCKIGLVIDCESSEELKTWAALNIGDGELLNLLDPAPEN